MTRPVTGATARPIWIAFLAFLAPMMLANVLQSLSGTLNSVFLGHMIGVEAMAAATVFFPVMFFFIAFAMGVSMGTTILVGQAYGAKDIVRVRQIAGAALALTLAGGLLVAVLGGSLAGPLMAALQTPEEIRAEATSYARIMLIAMPLMFVFILWTSILRGVGDAVTPLWTLVVSTLAGLLVTPALIVGWGGLPKLGVASAAVASLVSMIAAMAWLAWFLNRRNDPLAPNAALFRYVRFEWKTLALVMRLGLPSGVQMVIMAIAELVLLGLANSYGTNATAAYGAINQVIAYVQFPAMSIGVTASILGAQAIGAGRISQLGEITRTGLLMNLAITGTGVALVYVFSGPIIAMFITEPDVVALTRRLLHIVLWSIVIFGWAVVFSSMMRASGTVLAPTALSIAAIVLVEVPVAYVLSRSIGMDGVWLAYPAAFCAMLMFQGAFYALVWRRKKIAALV
jgi:putative MATE family efflux protein